MGIELTDVAGFRIDVRGFLPGWECSKKFRGSRFGRRTRHIESKPKCLEWSRRTLIS